MTYPGIPTVANGRVLSRNQTDTSQTRTFPNLSSLTKSSGDLLIAIAVAYQSTATANAVWSGWGGGFTEFGDSSTTTTCTIGVAYKVSDGTESGTFTVTQGAAVTGQASLILLSIPNIRSATVPEVAFSVGTGSIDPPSLNPAAWDVADTLWIAVGVLGETSTGGAWDKITATNPTNYSDIHVVGTATDAVGAVDAAVAFRQTTASSEDPGTFTNDTSNTRWRAATIAVCGPLAPNTGASTDKTITWAGSSDGVKHPVGANTTATMTWAGTATGRQPIEGPSTATLCRTTTSGVQGGTASGAIGWAGTATGARQSVGSATGAIGWAGTATGRGPHPPTVAGVSADSRSLIDQNGDPILPYFDTLWNPITIAGDTSRNGNHTWQEDLDYWVDTRAADGFTGLKWCLFGQVINGSYNIDGRTFDTKYPFGASAGGTAYADPSDGLASDYWARVDYLLDAAKTAGLTCFVFAAATDDFDKQADPGVLREANGDIKATSEFTAFGDALGDRYKDYDNIVWCLGSDYYDTYRTQLEALVTAVKAAGANQPWTVENWSDQFSHHWTTSRYDDTANDLLLGQAIADINGVYIYDPQYLGAEDAWPESPTIPAIWLDGNYDSGSGDSLDQRHRVGWSVTYGMWGVQYGDTADWAMPNGWRTELTTWASTDGIKIIDAVAAMDGWEGMVPDFSSTFITAGRSSGTTYVTGSYRADGNLAIVYIPNAANAITIDTSHLTAGYTVTWVDPADGSTYSGTPGSSQQRASNNSDGDPDWLLILAKTAQQGNATGAIEWAGSATGARQSVGSASGAIGWAGSATGTKPLRGSATGAVDWVGSSTGVRNPVGIGTGNIEWHGIGHATGVMHPVGSGSGTIGWAGSADGVRHPVGTGAGTDTYEGSATGARQSVGSGTGSITWEGSADGEAPAVGMHDGEGSGAVDWVGSSTGVRHPVGSASGAIGWAGTAVGGNLGVAVGGIGWAGSATGVRAPVGSGSGTIGWAGTADGVRHPVGASTGAIGWAGTATGARASSGQAVGTIGWVGSAQGFAPGGGTGQGTGTIGWAGSAGGVRHPVGASTGTTGYAGSATGATVRSGTGTGSVAWAGVAGGTTTRSGAGTGAVGWAGVATGASGEGGSGTGAITWVGSATGVRHPVGAASGSIGWAGSATGTKPLRGSATGAIGWVGSATGITTPEFQNGSASGAIGWVGAATGARQSRGSAVGTIGWAGNATGGRGSSGHAIGGIGWDGHATGQGRPNGFAVGTITWAGTATGNTGLPPRIIPGPTTQHTYDEDGSGPNGTIPGTTTTATGCGVDTITAYTTT